MSNFKTISVVIIAIGGVAASLMVAKINKSKLHDGEASLEEQRGKLAALAAEHERLALPTNRPANLEVTNNSVELAKLRAELASLQKQTNDLGRVQPTNNIPQMPPANPSEPHPQEYYTQLHALAGGRTRDAMCLGRAFENYAYDHQGQSPASLDQLTSYLVKMDKDPSWSGTNQFEIIFHGTMDSLNGLPWGSVAVVRCAGSWAGPDGHMMTVYGFPSGSSQIVDLNYVQTWEAQHVIQSQPDQGGQ